MLLASTSFVVNSDLATWIIFLRASHGLQLDRHLKEFSRTNSLIEKHASYGASLDFNHLRQTLGMSELTDEQALHYYFVEQGHSGELRFETPPIDFSYEVYRDVHADLASFSNRRLMQHFLSYGRKEGRRYK
jgi:hypothetical protein